MSVHDDLLALVQRLPHEVLRHEHVHTSADAARVRGTRLEEAAKALVLEAGSRLVMCVVSGHRRLDLKRVKQLLGERNVRLAHPDRVLEATGCPVGTVPPLPALLGLEGYADEHLFDQEHVVFSAASHHASVRMGSEAWLRLSGARRAAISKPS